MKLVLAGTEITSLISIKECEGPLYPLSLLLLPSPLFRPVFHPSSDPPTGEKIASSSSLSLSLSLCSSKRSLKLRKHISFILLPRSRLCHSAHPLDPSRSISRPSSCNSSLVSTRVNVITDERDTVAHFPSPFRSRVSSDARMLDVSMDPSFESKLRRVSIFYLFLSFFIGEN